MSYTTKTSSAKGRFRSCAAVLAAAALLFLGLQYLPGLLESFSAPQPTPTDRPAVARPTPTLLPVIGAQAAQWKPVRSVCLKVQVSYPAEWESSSPDSIASDLRRMLTAAGVQVLESPSACQATLELKLTAEPIASQYTGLGTCYQSARYFGHITLSAPGSPPLEKAVSGASTTPTAISEKECITTPEGAGGWSAAGSMAVVRGLQAVWGSAVLVNALDSGTPVSSLTLQAQNELRALKADALPYLAQGLRHNDPAVRAGSAGVISDLLLAHGMLTSKDVEAVRQRGMTDALPDLRTALDDESAAVRTAALEALNRLTQQNFTTPQEWQKWWNTK